MNPITLINPNSSKPKYQQLIDYIVSSIENGTLTRGQQLPSINEIANKFSMARMTVTKAYYDLQEKGLIVSHHGKGFYVTSTDTRSQLNLFVLFDSLTPYKEVMYDAFVKAIGEKVTTTISFHNHNLSVLENLILNNLGHYNHFVVIPHFNQDISKILKEIPKEKLLILDIDAPSLSNDYAIICQNFMQNIYNGLCQAIDDIKKYETLSLVLSSKSFQYTPDGIIQGFEKFCEEYHIPFEIIPNFEGEEQLQANHAYFVFRESDLVRFVNWTNKKEWKLGQNIGLLSYDDTPIKALLAEGISVISNDFELMGTRAAQMILNHEKGRVFNESNYIKRKSL